MARINVGDPAPDFSLPDSDGTTRHLRDALARGPVVLIFYVLDNTPGWTIQLAAVRDDRARFDAANVTVWALNNGGAASHKRFADKVGFDAPILVDTKFGVSSQYDAVMGLGPLKFVNRTVVGIARDGTVTYYKRGMPSIDEILTGIGAPGS